MALTSTDRRLRLGREYVDEGTVLDRETRSLAASGELGCDGAGIAERVAGGCCQEGVLKRLLESQQDSHHSNDKRQPETQSQE